MTVGVVQGIDTTGGYLSLECISVIPVVNVSGFLLHFFLWEQSL